MSKKSIFVILWLTLFFSLPALALDEQKKCWEEAHPVDLGLCLAQLQITINNVKEGGSIPPSAKNLQVKNLKVQQKRLERLEKNAGKVDRARRAEATSRAIAGVDRCPSIWVHPQVAGRGWSGGLGKVVVHLVNNTGGVIEKVTTSSGVIIQNICPGTTATFHLTTGGNQSQQFFVSAETTALEGGVRKVKMWQKNYYLYFSSPSVEETWELTSVNKTNQYQ